MPATSETSEVALWTPLMPGIPDAQSLRGAHYLPVIGRLKTGSTPEQAEADLNAIDKRIAQSDSSYAGYGGRVVSLHRYITGDVSQGLLILFAAVSFVLLIACSNVTNLMLAQGTARRREVAVRLALGASRGRLIRQLLTENMILAALGGAMGLLLAGWAIDLLPVFAPTRLPRANEIVLDGGVITFTVFATLVTGVLFGLAPALQSTKLEFGSALKDGNTNLTAGLHRNRLLHSLVIAEVALTSVLLVGAGLMINSFARLVSIDPGFSPARVTTFQLGLPLLKYPGPNRQAAFYQELVARLQALPGTRAAGASLSLPVNRQSMTSPLVIEGEPETKLSGPNSVQYTTVLGDYFRAMGIPVLQGRAFAEQDDAQAARVIMINAALARRFFPGESPIGRKIGIYFKNGREREVIGVVGDARHSGLDKEAPPQVYVPFGQNPSQYLNLVVRSDAKPAALVAAVRDAVRSIDKDQPIDRITTMPELLAQSVAEPRFYTGLLTSFALIAFALAALGIYGVISYSVTQRTHELGIRIALGADPRNVLKLVLGRGMVLTLIGVSIGLVGSLALTRLMSGLLFGISPTDPATFALATLLLTGVALVACYVPARRATRVDPMVALRYE
jgi:putative ABC transport system permease protein